MNNFFSDYGIAISMLLAVILIAIGALVSLDDNSGIALFCAGKLLLLLPVMLIMLSNAMRSRNEKA